MPGKKHSFGMHHLAVVKIRELFAPLTIVTDDVSVKLRAFAISKNFCRVQVRQEIARVQVFEHHRAFMNVLEVLFERDVEKGMVFVVLPAMLTANGTHESLSERLAR